MRGRLEHASTETAQVYFCPPIPRSALPVVAVKPPAPLRPSP